MNSRPNRKEPMDEVLAAAMAKLDTPEAPAEIERTVMSAFDAQSRRPTRRTIWWIPAAAAAMLAAGIVALHRPSPPHTADAPFVEIPYEAPLAPYERTEIVRMDVPVAALIAAGFEVHAADTGVALRADVLFGQDGRAHAIRLLTNSERRIDQ